MRKSLSIVFLLLFITGCSTTQRQGATALPSEVVQAVSSTNTVLDGAVASSVIALPDKTIQIADSTNHIIDSFGSGGSGTYPSGAPPQFGGYSATNTPEAETLGGAATFTRTGANAYSLGLTAPYGATTYTVHGVLLGEAGSNISVTAACAAGSVIYGQGTADPICSTLILPNSATQGDLLIATSANTVGSLTDVAVGQLLESGGTSTVPKYNGTAPGLSGQTFTMTTAGVGSWTSIDSVIPLTGELGVSASTASATLLVSCDVPARAGHLTKLTCTTDLSGTCTTAPTFGTRDVTTTTNGTGTVACGNTAGTVTQSTPGLSFAAGDQVCITRTVNGGTCLTTDFSVMAHTLTP